MNDNATPLSADEERLFEERLPWYVNGTLGAAERAWIEARLAASPAAAQRLAREQALSRAVPDMLAPAAQDIGLDRLLARVRADKQVAMEPSRAAAAAPGWRKALSALQQWLAQPRLATAMALVVFAQAGLIGWLAAPSFNGQEGASEFRSVGVTEVRTLRVTFIASASETQIRTALINAGARIVGGPTQLGEYWVASSMVSLEEIKASLVKSGLVASMEVDLSGPRGQ